MYIRLHKKRTKKYYKEIVDLAIEETKNLMEMSPKVAIYASIYNQLVDIKQNIIGENKVFSRFELYKRYSLGAVAVKNFDENADEYAQKLIDSYGGTFDYNKKQEDRDFLIFLFAELTHGYNYIEY